MARSWRDIAVVLVGFAFAVLSACECDGTGAVGDPCDQDEDCNDGLVCSPLGMCAMGDTDSGVTPGTDSTTGTDSAMGTDSALGTDSGSSTDSGLGTDAGPGGLVISWVTGSADANCQPVVPPDPWNVGFTIRYDNTAGTVPHTATITSATWAGYTMTVTPTGSGAVAAGASLDVGHTKMSLAPSPMGDCSLCGMQTTVDLMFDVDGVSVPLTSPPFMASCVF